MRKRYIYSTFHFRPHILYSYSLLQIVIIPRVAIFGYSYVSRLSRYCGGDLKVPSEVKVFGKGGMKAESGPSDMLSQVFDFRPDLVVLNLGGNDIRPASSPKTIFNCLFT